MWEMFRIRIVLTVMAIAVAAELPAGQGVVRVDAVRVLKGQVAATKSTGEVVPPDSATVYVFFSREVEGNSAFWNGYDLSTAGGQFHYQLNVLVGENKDAKSLMKKGHHSPSFDNANKLAAYYLQAVDEAVTRVQSGLIKHQKLTWQLRTITPDAKGLWSVEDLQPGGYDVVVRGRFAGNDAYWEGTADLRVSGSITVRLTRPKLIHFQ